MRQRLATGVLVCLLSASAAFAYDAKLPRVAEKERPGIGRLLQKIIKLFVPTTTGDYLSPPKP